MHHDLKHFYECAVDIAKCDTFDSGARYIFAYRAMLDTHPHCEELLDRFAELAAMVYGGDESVVTEMNEIEKTLDSNRVPF
jgi:hypothetical protein